MRCEMLAQYYILVDFLADFLGDTTEVVLHDLTDLEHSVVKIRNGHISGRKEGDPATDLVMKILNNNASEPYVCNYKSASKNKKHLKSASFYIRDSSNKIVGMLCLNSNIEGLLSVQDYLYSFLNGFVETTSKHDTEHASENLGQSINEIINSSIERALSKYAGRENSLSIAEKEDIIATMNAEGVFLLKGAVSKVALALNMSESSMYRYLKQVKSS